MDKEKEIAELRARLKELSASKYRRYNVMLKKEVFAKLEKLAKLEGVSKPKALSNLILKN